MCTDYNPAGADSAETFNILPPRVPAPLKINREEAVIILKALGENKDSVIAWLGTGYKIAWDVLLSTIDERIVVNSHDPTTEAEWKKMAEEGIRTIEALTAKLDQASAAPLSQMRYDEESARASVVREVIDASQPQPSAGQTEGK